MLIITVQMKMIKKTLKEMVVFHPLKIILRLFHFVNKLQQIKVHPKINQMINIWKILFRKIN